MIDGLNEMLLATNGMVHVGFSGFRGVEPRNPSRDHAIKRCTSFQLCPIE